MWCPSVSFFSITLAHTFCKHFIDVFKNVCTCLHFVDKVRIRIDFKLIPASFYIQSYSVHWGFNHSFFQEEEIQKSEGTPPETKSISKEKQELGEIIYEKLLARYPTEASKLTGMLLQMEYRDLLRVIAEPEHLNNKVELALRVLQGEERT